MYLTRPVSTAKYSPMTSSTLHTEHSTYWFYSTKTLYTACHIFSLNRSGVTGAVYKQLCHSICQSVDHPYVQNLQYTVYLKPSELGSWDFESAHPHHMSHVMCHVSVGGGFVFNGAYPVYFFSRAWAGGCKFRLFLELEIDLWIFCFLVWSQK